MTQPTIYIAVTSHGFGHAVRTASVAAAIKRLNPDIDLVFVTTAPEWLLQSYVQDEFVYRPRIFDVGVIQQDSLTMDAATTLAKMQQIKEQQEEIIKQEVDLIQKLGVGLILADIPPLAGKIAEAAGIPCWSMGNFGWDFIYRPWGEAFAEIVTWIEDCYSKCDSLFRLPLAESMSAFKSITDVGLTGGIPQYTVEELRDRFGITAPIEKTVLLTFGGLGLQAIPYETLQKFPNWQFITFDRNCGDFANLLKVSGKDYRPVDFMPLCGRVISKPGYSTFAEALRLDIPIVSLTREGFAESEILLQGIRDYSQHQIVKAEDFFAGNWNFLHQNLLSPNKETKLAKDGSETIAQEVINYFASFL
ncbi:MAG: glycosyl transferase [Xenococcaceae cyanobacterium MO_167.B27]|nr:glycosyl transferase [Xenococcaceae cyanobacterium MO_167.B27]